MVMLQDWSSDDSLGGPFDKDSSTLGYSRHVETNINLIILLYEIFGLTLSDVYCTNLFPFIKLGPMNAPIPQRDLMRAARDFALPQIRIVNPELVICLGKNTFNAVGRVCGLSPRATVALAIESPFNLPNALPRVWCQAHTGRLGRNNRNKGGIDHVTADWRKMKADVDRLVKPSGGKTRKTAVESARLATTRTTSARRTSGRPLTIKEKNMNYFILNNKRERPHRSIYHLDDELKGFPIYDYDDKQARHAFNLDFQEMKAGSLALVFGSDLAVKDIFRVTGTKKKYAEDIRQEVLVIYGEHVDTLPETLRYRDFITINKLSNPNLDPNNNFRRGMLVAHVY